MTADHAGNNESSPDLASRLRDVRSVGAITGAGISRESGISTYRGQGGIYDDPEEGDRTVEALSGSTMARDPERTWRVVARLVRQAGQARPNAAHEALAKLEDRLSSFAILTQNVDGLHRMAGSRNVIEIHGNILSTRCLSCGERAALDRAALETRQHAPRCEQCEGLLRPDVVLFEELLPTDSYERVRQFFHVTPPDAVIVIGTTALFPYITDPVLVARRARRLTVEVNPEPTVLSDVVEFSLRGSGSTYLPLIARACGA